MVAPVVPGLNDAEIPAIVQAAARAGARRAGWILLRLPHGVAALFEDWLERHAPLRKARVLARIREVRGGRMNDPGFHTRMRGSGGYAAQIDDLFQLACRRARLSTGPVPLSSDAFRKPPEPQLSLW
jgi:DNA repair photolyase